MGAVERVFVAVVGLFWLLITTVACSQQGVNQPKGISMPEKTIETVLKEQTDNLMAIPGVVGTAQGLCSGKPCVKVYVVKKTSDLVKQIPATLEGYAVEIQVTGEIKALDRK